MPGRRWRSSIPASGEIRTAQIFVAVLGASNYTYAEATWSQGLADWIGSHVRAFAYFDGVPAILVPDNLRSGVSKTHRYEPDLNPTYLELANHYGVAWCRHGCASRDDLAKAEAGVLLVERWILARLRHRTFFSLAELNGVMVTALEALNTRPFKKLDGSRRSHFEAIDRPALRPLPLIPYVYATWKTGTGEHRLPRRSRRALLLRALHPGEAGAGRASHRAYGRVLPPPPTHRQPCALRPEGPPHHRRRAHAQGPSRVRRVDPGTPGALGREERAGHRRGDRSHHGQSPPSPAGLPLLPGDPASGRALR
jgi:hypothetical protein